MRSDAIWAEDVQRCQFEACCPRAVFTATQRGIAGEELFSAVVTLTSDGNLELFKPVVDDDGTVC